MAAFGAVLATGDTVFTAARVSPLSHSALFDHGWPMVTVTTLSCSVMGALVVSRYPKHPIGWLLLVSGLSSISISSEAYSLWAFDGRGHGPALAGHLTGWPSALFGAPFAMSAVLLIFLIGPHGRFLSDWCPRVAGTAGARTS